MYKILINFILFENLAQDIDNIEVKNLEKKREREREKKQEDKSLVMPPFQICFFPSLSKKTRWATNKYGDIGSS